MNKKSLGLIVVIVVIIASFFGVDLGLDNQKNQSAEQSKESTQNNSQFKSTTDSPQATQGSSTGQSTYHSNPQSAQNGLSIIRDAFDHQKSNVQVEASGRVKAILKDDNEGLRHQKFILSLDNGLTVLVAHNIDLAPRIENLSKGDEVQFYGEYEYSEQGGVIHWTHRDPQNRHISGWLKHQGKTYQ